MGIQTAYRIGEKASIIKKISEKDVLNYAEITIDYNPIHIDKNFAVQSRFGARIAHGILVAGLISTVLGKKLPGPGAIYLHQSLEFREPVYIDDTITAVVQVISWNPIKRIIKLDTYCCNQKKINVIEGEAILMVENQDNKAEKV